MAGDETTSLIDRYRRRGPADRYALLNSDVWQSLQERHRVLWRLWASLGWRDLSALRYTEVGCGAGGALLDALRVGFSPEHLCGLELQPERLAMARRVLPEAVRLHGGDARHAPVETASQDVVAQHTVFSSLLEDRAQAELAAAMWRWLKTGGAVLWYDFTVDNPANRDVRGVPLRRVRELFPEGRMRHWRVTLAPPIARRVCRVHPSLYGAFNRLPLLRTHLLCWIEKPSHHV